MEEIFRESWKTSMSDEVHSVQIGDFNFDGKLDLLVDLKLEDGSHAFKLFIHEQTGDAFYRQSPDFSIDHSDSTATILDLTGTHRDGILYFDKEKNKRQYTYLSQNTLIHNDFVDFLDTNCAFSEDYAAVPFSTPNFNSFVDLNGDCRADLFITSVQNNRVQQEFYIKQKDSERFCFIGSQPLEKNVESLKFIDMNFDGKLDKVELTSDPKINIYKNLINIEGNCVSNVYDITPFHLNQDYDFDIELPLFRKSPVEIPQLRIMAHDRSLYPDILITLKQDGKGQPFLLSNRACSQENCQELGRQLVIQEDFNKEMRKVFEDQSVVQTSFFDFKETGMIDLFCVIQQGTRTSIHAVFNNYTSDYFFVRYYGQNGALKQEHGSPYHGTSFMSSIADSNGKFYTVHVNQLHQTQNTALELPYAFQGLGRLNNYIENLNCGVSQSNTNYKLWTPIIPNSQLVFYPYTNDPSAWSLEILLDLSQTVVIVVMIVLLLLIVLGAIIVRKVLKERKEDQQEQTGFVEIFV